MKNAELREPEGNLFDPRNKRKGIAFLECDPPGPVNCLKAYNKLSRIKRNKINNSISHWISGGVDRRRHHPFHGKGFSKYRTCYVFKDISNQLRFYGFVHNPTPCFRLCVIVLFKKKKEDKTDTQALDTVLSISESTEVIDAVRRFSEEQGLV